MNRVFDLTADLEAGSHASLRADKYLQELFSEQEELAHLSRSQIQRLIDEKSITVDGKAIRSKDPIPHGVAIQVSIPAPQSLEVAAENIPLHILFEDEHLVVVNKQPGLTVHPSDTQHSGTLVNALLYHIKDLSGIGGVMRPGIVHRIDKNTSGALVISKNDATHTGLAKLFATHTIDRKYWALTYGMLKDRERTKLTTKIGRNPADRKKMMVNPPSTDLAARSATSHFQVLEAYGIAEKLPFSGMVEATLETGRTHQVRVHLNHLNCSLLGDPQYGTPSSQQPKWKSLPVRVQEAVEKMPGQALHARVLGFKHPITGKNLYFEADPFPEFQNLLNTLREYK
jgi:23S rRNA pseudouridine1911/1915/1917 synthase